MVAISAVLLVGFLTGFFWLNEFTQLLNAAGIASISGNDLVLASVGGFQISVSIPSLRVFLAAGSVFFEFIIIMQAMFDRILDTLKALIRPLLMLFPISAFVYYTYETFEPVLRSFLPPEFGGNPDYIATAASNGSLARSVLITFGAMLVYLLFNAVLGGGATSAEVKQLRSELKRCRDRLKQG